MEYLPECCSWHSNSVPQRGKEIAGKRDIDRQRHRERKTERERDRATRFIEKSSIYESIHAFCGRCASKRRVQGFPLRIWPIASLIIVNMELRIYYTQRKWIVPFSTKLTLCRAAFYTHTHMKLRKSSIEAILDSIDTQQHRKLAKTEKRCSLCIT